MRGERGLRQRPSATASSSRAGQWKVVAPGGVARGVVVDAGLRPRPRPAGSARGSVAVRRPPTPPPRCPRRTARRAPCRRRRGSSTIAAGSSAASAHHLRAERGAALVRLDHQRQAEPLHHRVEHRLRAELAEGRVRQRDPVRRAQPGAGQLGLGGRLVPGPPAGRRRRARRTGRRAAPARPAPSRSPPRRRAARRDGVRRVGRAAARSATASVSHSRTSMPDVAQRGRQPPAGPQRHLALVGQPAGQHRHVRSVTAAFCLGRRSAIAALGEVTWRSRRGLGVSGVGACGPDRGRGRRRAAEGVASRPAPPPARRPAAGRPR